MSASAKKLADQFLAAARKSPGDRPEICRRAAYTFMGLAQDPKNVRSSGQLAQIGMHFATAAHRERPPVMDDFNDLLQETVVAYNEVGDDQMDLISRRREIHDERTPSDPGRISIAPESFNRDATLGRSAVITSNPTPEQITQGITQSQNVAFWQGVKKEAQAMTVDTNFGFPPASNPGVLELLLVSIFARTYADIEYGSDGNRTKVRCDIGLGNRATVVGNYIAVTVGMDPPPTGGFSTSAVVTCGASIGAFAAPSSAPVLRTVFIDELLVGGLAFSQIPLKAVQLLPIQSNLPLGDTLIISFRSIKSATPIVRFFYTQASNISSQPIPIPDDIAFVHVESPLTNSGACQARLVFQLAL